MGSGCLPGPHFLNMADQPTQFETKDLLGSTETYSGTATVTPQSIPASPGKVIQTYLIENLGVKSLLYSDDGGTTWKTLVKGSWIIWDPKGGVYQFQIKTTAPDTTDFEAKVNFEP